MAFNLASGLEGKGVLVTGAAGGIGKAVALAFAAAGAKVCAVDLNQQAVDAVAKECGGRPHMAVGFDLRNFDGLAGLLNRTQKEFGTFDVLACVAGALVRRMSVDEVTMADWDLQHDVNLKSVFFLNQAAGKLFKAQGRGGRIINFTSQGWWSGGFGGSVAYAASKGGVVSMTRGLARSYAKDKITVNAVAPGAVDTAMMRSGMTEEQLAAQVTQIPIGYMAGPDDLAGTVLFLASDQASYITGATINVTGGWLMY
jgi:NAD(P)-dependent dehydrogenase (short-subunit alcohol dehydrogenase family)